MAAVKNAAFLLTSATVMIGKFGVDDVFALTPEAHSVGMVKNVKITMTSSEIELMNGIQQNLVDSQKTNVKLALNFEGYEFSARNLQLALGISGTTIQYKRGALTANAGAAATELVIGSAPVLGEADTAITALGDIPAGSTLLLQKAGETDFVYPVKTVGAATGTGPYTVTIEALPSGITFAIGDSVWLANDMSVGDQAPMDYFNVKMSGVMSSNNKPIVVILPKVKILKGFDLNMSETAYGNLPFEITPYYLTSAEVSGRLDEIGTLSQGRLYTAG